MNVLRISVLLGVVACSCTDSSAHEVHWQKNLRLAARESAKSQKPMLMRFTASWCGYCKKMLATTFRDRQLVEQINGCFIPVVVDGDNNAELSRALGVTGFPTMVILSPKMTLVKKITGYQTAVAMRRHLGGMCPGRAKPVTATRTIVKPAVAPKPLFGGHCLVSMLDNRKLEKGAAKHAVQYGGVILWFASDEHRRRFKDDPAKYAPGNGGICPVTAAENGTQQVGDPRNAVIYHGRLWFFTRIEHRKTFAANPRRYAKVQTARRD